MEGINLRGGYALMRATWLSWMQYRSFFFILAFGWMIPPLAALFVWLAAVDSGSLAGFTRGSFVAYYLILILVNQITYAQSNWTLGDVIREGNLNFWLTRPIPGFWNVLASEMAGKAVYLLFVIPVTALLAIVLKPELETSWIQVLLFLFSIILAWMLRFLWGFWLASLAFWTSRADGLLALQDGLVFLLSGMVAPLALLPAGVSLAARILPFHAMIGSPVEILIGSIPLNQTGFALGIQFAWVVTTYLICRIVWHSGLRRYAAVGG